MKKFFLNTFYLIIPFALIIAFVNISVDPANFFSNEKYETEAAAIVLKGNNIENFNTCDERILLQKIILGIKVAPETIVIGTSRSLEISGDIIEKKNFLNCSVSHANLNDFIAILGMLDSLKKLPKEIYIESSPTLINPSTTDEWLSIYEFYEYGLSKMNIEYDSKVKNSFYYLAIQQLNAIFSFAYFQKSITFLKKKKENTILDIGKNIPKNFGKMYDGSITYPSSYMNSDTLKAIADAEVYIKKSFLNEFDYKYLNILKKIIDYLKNNNIKIYMLNLPIQQDCYKIIAKENKLFGEIKNGTDEFAKKENVTLLGTFNPFEANLNRSQFYDPLHCNKEALKSVLKIVQYQAKN